MSEQVPLEILIKIRDEIAGLNRARAGLQGAKKDADGLGTALRQGLGIGTGLALVTTGVALLTNTLRASAGEAFRLATEVTNVSKALDMTSESFQVMKDLVEDTGGEVGSLTMAVKEMREALNASGKGGGAADAFRTLNIDADAFSRLPVEQKLEAIAKATFNAENRTSALGAASELLGSRNLPKVTNALQVLARDGYAKVAEEAKKAGQVMSEDAVRRLHAAELRIKNFKDSVTIGTGEALAYADQTGESLKKDFLGTVMDFLKIGPLGMGGGDFAMRLALDNPSKPPDAPSTPAPTLATREALIQARIGAAEWKAGAIQSSPLFTETEQRKALLPVLKEQEELYKKLIALKYADVSTQQPGEGATEEQLQRWKELTELEQKLTSIRQQRMNAVDTPLARLWREMSDTTAMVNNTLAQGISQGVSQLGSDIWEAMKGTQEWGDAFVNLGNMAGRILTQIITQMLVVKMINMALGLFGFQMNGGGPTITKMPTPTMVAAAGGGDFITRGPTTFTVGDNPGGIEAVSVRPISGIGQTMINGNRIAMAGGGNALVRGRSDGLSIVVNQVLQVSTGVADTVRAEIFQMLPAFRELAVDATREAMARGDV